MSIIFTGFYGNSNTGDDAFCLISDWGSNEYWDKKKPKFFGRNLPVRKDETTLQNSVLQKSYFKRQNLIELYCQGLLGKNLIYSGGSIFHSDISGWQNKSYVFNQYKKAGLINLGAIGVSLGPYKTITARESIKEYLKRFSFIALRDKTSYEDALAMDLSIPVIESFDMAALLPLMYPIKKNINSKITIGISVCDYEKFIKNGDFMKDQNRLKKTIETLNLLFTQIDFKIKIFVFNNHSINGDLDLSLKLQSLLNPGIESEIIFYNPKTFIMWEAIGNCSFVLSTRLHAGIFSCFSSTPFLQIEYHKKCGDFLNDIGYNDDLRIGDLERDPKEVVEIILNILKNGEIHSLPIETLQQKALRNFTHTKSFL